MQPNRFQMKKNMYFCIVKAVWLHTLAMGLWVLPINGEGS